MSEAQAVMVSDGLDALSKLSKAKKHPAPFLLHHTLFFLPIIVAISLLVLILTLTVPPLFRFVQRKVNAHRYQPILLDDADDDDEELPPPTPVAMPSRGLIADFKAHVRSLQEYGSVLFLLEVVRTLSLCALLGLSIYAAIQAESPEKTSNYEALGNHWGQKKKKHRKNKNKHKGHHDKSTLDDYSSLEWGEFGVCGFYTYCLFFAFILLSLRPATPLRRHLIAHLDILLFLGFCLYAYRDLWPLCTYYLVPTDLDNAITWSRVAILGVAAVVIPLIRPRTYVPVDPENPTPKGEIHPEQVAPWLFFVFYEFMTGLVWKAWKTPALPYDDLHPTADYDRAEYLYKIHMPTLDPLSRKARGLKPRHIFFSLISNFRWEAFMTSFMCVIAAVSEIASSVGINQLLAYLENGGKDAKYRPIVWIAVLFLGPTIASLSIQYYIFVMTRALVRGESVLTQLLFDHALRLRMKDTTADDEISKEANNVGPVINIEEASEPDGSSTEIGSDQPKDEAPNKEAAEAAQARGQGLAGKINVLMAADVESVLEGRDLPLVLVYTPIQFALCVVFLYQILSWSSIVGMLTMVATMPVPGIFTRKNAQIQQKRMVATDARIDVITEAVGALRMIKMFGWEQRIFERVAAKREVELGLIWKRRLTSLAIIQLNFFLPVLTMVVTFAVYTVVEKKQLTAAKVFTSMTVFELIKSQMGLVFYMINNYVTAYVSLNRIDKFTKTSEMVDEYTEGFSIRTNSSELLEAQQDGLIRVRDATFTWGSAMGVDSQDFRLRIPEVTFVKGKINLISGPTGSGKSSVLKALTGELHFIPGKDGFFHLPREGGVSYAAQESWCLSESVKDNIIFGEPFDETRYAQVIHDCGLETDLKLFDDGDATEIGEKGVTLSGGQKARITLARAVYDKSEVVLLDDIFSALDTLTSRWIIDNLFKGTLLKGRTVLLITHHVGLVAPIADFLLTLNENGTVKSALPIAECQIEEEDEVDSPGSPAAPLSPLDDKKLGIAEDLTAPEQIQEQRKVAKLIQAEEKGEGRISRRALFSFFSNFGGPIFWLVCMGLLFSGQGFAAFQTFWLGRWAKAYKNAEDYRTVSIPFYLGLYVVWVVLGLASLALANLLFSIGAIKASRTIHKRLTASIFGAYLRFMDSTPIGRIISRFTKDMKSIDGQFPETFLEVADITFGLLIKFGVVIALVPIFSLPAVFIGALGGVLGELYIHGQLSVKREMSNAKSPLFSHFSTAVNGIVSIRAYGAQEKLRAEARKRADKYTRSARAFFNLNRWVTVRIDMLGGLFASVLAAVLVYGPQLDPSTVGFALSQAISFSTMILWWVRLVNEMEVQGNSVERIEDYLVIDQEPESTQQKEPPASWPTSGEIVLEKLSAKYSTDGPTVLDKLEVSIKSGEKVGIVGRTGSGKSTLALALLRMIPTTGSIIIDGKRTENINLHALRSHVTIIPQDPILLSGTLRFNLDPFDDHDDATLNDALQASGLGRVRRAETGTATPQRLTLDYQIAAGGGNLSQGQRQLVALARALVRNSKILILDEATASVDFETDALIQRSIRSLPDTTTVLTVAHRLSTVMDYDKIMVLGGGKLLEYDAPDTLKRNKSSYFAKLVQAMEG